jgi:CMP-N-acetylneuraminic acid synthetase
LANKAWQPLGQYPLLAYTLLAASQAHGLSQTVLYTDDEAWQPWVTAFGLSWPSQPRPHSVSHAKASSVATVQHWVRQQQAEQQALPEWLMLLQPTSPLRCAHHIDAALALLSNALASSTSYDGVVSVATITKPLPWLLHQSEALLTPSPLPLQPLTQLLGEAQLPTQGQAFLPSGGFYLLKTQAWLALDPTRPLFEQGLRWLPFALPWWATVDVDTYDDLPQAQAALYATQQHYGLCLPWPKQLPPYVQPVGQKVEPSQLAQRK